MAGLSVITVAVMSLLQLSQMYFNPPSVPLEMVFFRNTPIVVIDQNVEGSERRGSNRLALFNIIAEPRFTVSILISRGV